MRLQHLGRLRAPFVLLVTGLLVGSSLVLATSSTSTAAVPATISGTVVVPPGYDVRDVNVSLVADGSPFVYVAEEWVEDDGTFAVEVPEGSFRIVFRTYNRDLVSCAASQPPAWWTGFGEPADGTCNGQGTFSPDVEALTVEYGDEVDLSDVPVLTAVPTETLSGTLVAPAGESVAGSYVDVWLNGDGAYGNGTGGWHRPGNVTTQAVGADGEFSFTLLNGYWSDYALRVTDPGGTYAFSFTNGAIDETTPGAGGVDFGAGSVGLVDVSDRALPLDLGELRLKLPTEHVSGWVQIEGVPEWGRTLTAVSDTVWSPATGTTYQWYRGGQRVDGATSPTYDLNAGEDGFDTSFTVRAMPSGDYASIDPPVESAPVVVTNTTPFNRALPTVSGPLRVGKAITATPGTWTPTYPPYSHAYQWLRAGVPVPGATGPSYVAQPADAGKALSVRVTTTDVPPCGFCDSRFEGPGVATSSAVGPVRFTPTVTVKAKQKSEVKRIDGKKRAKVLVTIAVRTGGPAAPGVVVLKDGAKRIGTAKLKRGKATLRLLLKPGRHRLVASHTQTSTVAEGVGRTRITVG